MLTDKFMLTLYRLVYHSGLDMRIIYMIRVYGVANSGMDARCFTMAARKAGGGLRDG